MATPVAQAESAAPTESAATPAQPTLADMDAALYEGASINVPSSFVEPVESSAPAEAAAPEGGQPPVEAPATPEPPVEEATPAAEAPELPDRIRTGQFDSEDKRALATFHAMNAGRKPGEAGYVSLAKVIAQLAENEPAPATPPATEPAAASLDLVTAKLETAKTALQELLEKKQEAVEFGSDTGDIDQQIEAQRELVDEAKLDAKLAQRDATQRQAQQAAQQEKATRAAQAAAEEEAKKQFPSVADKASPLGARSRALAAAMENPNHPEHSLLYSANAALLIVQNAAIAEAKEIERTTGTPFAQAFAALMAPAASITPAPAAAAPTEQRRILPASGNEGSAPPPPAKTTAEIVRDAGNDDSKLTSALYGDEPQQWVIG